MCGENSGSHLFAYKPIGSPPRVRGKRSQPRSRCICRRITPACAGKTRYSRTSCVSRGDHPRVCGENQGESYEEFVEKGSPPRVRGKLSSPTCSPVASRITPACAGKTTGCATRSSRWRDHPRVCGENTHSRIFIGCASGSPPRVRGKHFGNGVFPWLILVLSLNPL